MVFWWNCVKEIDSFFEIFFTEPEIGHQIQLACLFIEQPDGYAFYAQRLACLFG